MKYVIPSCYTILLKATKTYKHENIHFLKTSCLSSRISWPMQPQSSIIIMMYYGNKLVTSGVKWPQRKNMQKRTCVKGITDNLCCAVVQRDAATMHLMRNTLVSATYDISSNISSLLPFWLLPCTLPLWQAYLFQITKYTHFALRRKMLIPPIACLPAILLGFVNRPSGETDCIYEAKVKWTSTRP